MVSDALADRDGRPERMVKERVRIDVLARILRRDGRRGLARVRATADPNST